VEALPEDTRGVLFALNLLEFGIHGASEESGSECDWKQAWQERS
jgi:hypothetical protein